MKITGIYTYKFWAQFCNWLFVKITTDEGLYGWGEGSLHGSIESVETAITELSPLLIGKDPSGLERHWQALYHAWRWRGGCILSTAIGALDIALWDLEGKRLGVPVYRLLGGPLQTDLRVYASHWLSDVRTPQEAFAGAQEAVKRGFTAFKFTPLTREMLEENEFRAITKAAEIMEAARDGAGPEVDIFVECAEIFSTRSALRFIEALAPYRPGWIEEPLRFENDQPIIRLQHKSSIPIACGERLLSRWEVHSLLASGGCQVLQPDVMHAFGLTEVRKIASLADLHGISVAPHNPGGPICTAASMHLAASLPNFNILEEMEEERLLRDEICTEPVRYEAGRFFLSDKPGLGIDLNVDAFKGKEFRPQPYAKRSYNEKSMC